MTNPEESLYLKLMQDIVESGYDKPSRSGGTRFLVSRQLSFDLSKPTHAGKYAMVLPLLTTKQVSFKLIATELLWFLKASCDSTILADLGNHIWDGNGTREYLDSIGLKDYKAGQLGPIYGWQWRRFNAPYPTSSEKKKTIDQISSVIEGIKKDPWGRRHIVTAWNPEQLSQMALPPCHMIFQFVVRPQIISSSYYNIEDPKQRFEHSIMESTNKQPFWLDCIMMQRSGDVPLGVPFNIASYALLQHMICSLVGLTAGKLTIQINDAHIYHNQIDGCIEQLRRKPSVFPTLKFKRIMFSIDDFSLDDFELIDYAPQPAIKFPLSV